MADYDIEAAGNARDAMRVNMPRALCGACGKPMYQERAFPGVPTEWRHESSGQPISWSPSKHLASRTHVVAHGHHFEPVKGQMDRCSVNGCEAEMPAKVNRKQREPERLSAKQEAMRQSRLRGSQRGHTGQSKAKVHKRITF